MGLLQDTVDQFEKVIEMERTVLRKSIAKHERDLEEVSTELAMKEDELAVWQERVQQIQQDNEIKFCLAKARFDSAKFKAKGRNAASSTGANALSFIAEGDEPDCFAEGDEDEDEDEEVDIVTAAASQAAEVPIEVAEIEMQPHPGAEAANALADIVVGELAMLQKQWQELVSGMDCLLAPSLTPSRGGAPSGQESPARGGAPAVQAAGTPFPDGASRGTRMTVEQRIDRLQRDIRTETDRILQERGAPNGPGGRVPRNSGTSGMSAASGTLSAGGGSTPGAAGGGSMPVVSSSGSLISAAGAPGASGGRVDLVVKPSSGLNTPVQSSMGTAGYPATNDSQFPPGQRPVGAPVMSGSQPPSPQVRSVVPATDIQAQDGLSPVVSPVLPTKAPSFKSVGSAVRCVSPSAMQASQVNRSRVQQALPGRPLTGFAPATVRSADPLQGSIGSSLGPTRWAQVSNPYSAQVQAPQAVSNTQVAASSGTAPSPPPPVIGTSGLSLGGRGSGGSPSGVPTRAAPLQHTGINWR